MSDEGFKVQVNYKTPTGTLINVRANTTDELSVLLEGVGDYATQIAAVQQLINAAEGVAPLSTPPSTPSITPPNNFAPTPPPPASAGPTCVHGPRKYLAGVSKKTGQPYSMWVCPQPQGAEQCKPVN
jgi:hypothetical protein